MKNMKKAIAVSLSMAIVMGMSVPAMADDTSVDIDAPIYAFDVVDVIVPTTYAVAFNPEGLTVKVGSNNSTNQILSKSFGIINKSNKDKVITATLTVEDQNTNSGIVFVDTKAEVDAAEDGEYKIHLTVIPADENEVQVSGASADKDTAATVLGDVTMTGADDKAITLKNGENQVGFKLDKAVYTPKTTGGLELGGTTGNTNNVQNSFELTSLAGNGKGITAFAFGGEMNANAEWHKLQSGIKITAVYTNETAPSDAAVIDGTGALVKLNSKPEFTTGSEVGTINYTKGKDENALKAITKVEMVMPTGNSFNGYVASTGKWGAATDENNTITLKAAYLKYYQDAYANDATREATVTYTTEKDEVKTAKVNVKLR